MAETIYPSNGSLVYSGGYVFVGSGHTGWLNGSDYPVGCAFECKNSARPSVLTAGCLVFNSFDGVFYWPTVPIPSIDNNGVYFAGGNGTSGGFAIGYMPASVSYSSGAPDYDPVPDRAGVRPMWTVPVGWTQRAAKNTRCPSPGAAVACTTITLPDWALYSFVPDGEDVVLVLGYGGYVALISSKPPVSNFQIYAPVINNVGNLSMGATTSVAPVVYDPNPSRCGGPARVCPWGDTQPWTMTSISGNDSGLDRLCLIC